MQQRSPAGLELGTLGFTVNTLIHCRSPGHCGQVKIAFYFVFMYVGLAGDECFEKC